MQEQILKSRLWSTAELCGSVIELGGQRFEPDETKAYFEFKMAHAFTKTNRSVTAYGTAFHPGTVANSYASLLHQNVNYGHKLRAHDKTKEKKEIPRDYSLGAVVGVDYPAPPTLGWTIAVEGAPHIHGVGVIHKRLEKVPALFGEHLGGKHKWTVSLEVDYSLLQSGFIVGQPEKAKKAQAELMKETTPAEFQSLGLGYVPMENAPEELLDSYSFNSKRVTKEWDGLPVVLLKGGVNGKTHFGGMALVRFGAEREAEIQQMLAHDPDALELLEEDEAALVLRNYFEGVGDLAKRIGEAMG